MPIHKQDAQVTTPVAWGLIFIISGLGIQNLRVSVYPGTVVSFLPLTHRNLSASKPIDVMERNPDKQNLLTPYRIYFRTG